LEFLLEKLLVVLLDTQMVAKMVDWTVVLMELQKVEN